MNFNLIENILLKYYLEKIFQSLDFTSISDFLIEVLLKIFFKILATFVVSSNVSLILLNLLRYLGIFLSFILLKCCKAILNFVFKISMKLFDLILAFKNYRNICSSKNFHDEQLIILEDWYKLNERNPYANKSEKQELANRTNLSIEPVTSWLIHKRRLKGKTIQLNKCF
jgi:hypothetical protein